MQLRFMLLVAACWVAGCSYDNHGAFGEGDDDVGGGSSGASGGSSGGSEPKTCQNGRKDANEADVDCGAVCDTRCAVGATCTSAADCAAGNLCTAGTCAAPTATDGAKNGDESDVDCGGTTTSAPRCATGKSCNGGADCESRGCYQGACTEAPSCAVGFGGNTCGAGEIGSGAEAHESCCKSLELPGLTDELAPGKKVYVDKYEVTAGRMREFIRVISEANAGIPNVRGWLQNVAEPPAWQAEWTPFLPASLDNEDKGWGFYYTFGSISGEDSDFSSGFYLHGQNCAVGPGRPGFPTYRYDDQIATGVLQGYARRFTQEQLDVKALSCVPQAVLAAFCIWDGGVLASAAAIDRITADGRPSGATINVARDAGKHTGPYDFPQPDRADVDGDGEQDDGADRVAAPGRIPEDAIHSADGDAWMDLGGNLMEQVRADGARAFGLRKWGLGYGSVAAQNDANDYAQPAFKYAGAGGRCMRFR